MVALQVLLATAALQSIIHTSSSTVFGQKAGAADSESPDECFKTSSSIPGLVTCLDKFTVRSGYYNSATYAAAQPAGDQGADFTSLVNSLLYNDGACASSIPSSLKDFYNIQDFKEKCVLYEKSTLNGTYVKGWGTMIVPRSKSAVARNVHFSVPSPGSELGTIQQAASLFESTQSKSFLVPGRNYDAFKEISDCMPGDGNYKTDVTISTSELFFYINIVIHDWQDRNGGCPAASCAFIQIRGKGASTCPSDMIFLSAGIGRSAASIEWYKDSTARPVKSLQKSLQTSFPMRRDNITLPSESKCVLTGTKNIVGRYLNGVKSSAVCHTAATSETATGQFVQVEQSIEARNSTNFGAWSDAIQIAFPPMN